MDVASSQPIKHVLSTRNNFGVETVSTLLLLLLFLSKDLVWLLDQGSQTSRSAQFHGKDTETNEMEDED